MSGFRLSVLAISSCVLSFWAAANSSAANLSGVPPQLADTFLTFVKVSNEAAYHSIQSFVCQERIERHRARSGAEAGKYVDTITARVSFENGLEKYSEMRRKNRPLKDLAILEGAWSKGEFGTLLRQTQLLLPERPVVLESEEKTSSGYAAIYSFDVPSEASPWDLEVAGLSYRVAFHTRIWVSESSHLIERIERTSMQMPAALGIAEIRWEVTLRAVALNGDQWLLPYTAEYGVVYAESGRKEWNTMQFSDYHRYGAEVSVHFN